MQQTDKLHRLPNEIFQLATEMPSRSRVLKRRPKQKKVAAKFDNVFEALALGEAPSTFTLQAFQQLDSKKRVTQADLVRAFRMEGYSDGTARSQANQMMTLFPSLGIATRVKQTLFLNKSKIADRLRDYR